MGTSKKLRTSTRAREQKRRSDIQRASQLPPLEQPHRAISNVHQIASPQDCELCNRCRCIDFESIFSSSKLPGVHGLPLLPLGIIQTDANCSLCRLFDALRHPRSSLKSNREGYHLRLFCSLTILREKKDNTRRPSLALSVVHGKNLVREFNGADRTLCPDVGYIVPRSSWDALRVPRTVLEGSPIDPKCVNYGRIQEWLRRCDLNHPGSCHWRYGTHVVPISCIDCTTREIVQISAGVEYFALSYVWGSQKCTGKTPEKAPTGSKRGNDGRLPFVGVPEVVEDAMVVVQKLGKRYLWVDQYCIDQSNHDARRLQIRNMDLVYEGAYATLIACAGSDAGFGLPGVGKRTRAEQPSATTKSMMLMSSLPPLPIALKDATWMTRGWTYQEVVLSRRAIFFTQLQVYFVCSAMACCEATVSGTNDISRGRRNTFGLLEAKLIHMEDIITRARKTSSSELRQLETHICEFTSRDLTVDSDILDAFRGLLSRSSFYSYYGIPIAAYDTARELDSTHEVDLVKGFLMGLYWHPRYTMKSAPQTLFRRTGFPSWSWTGWKGSVEYRDLNQLNDGYQLRPIAKVWVEDETEKLVTFSHLQRLASGRKVLPELSPYLLIETIVIQLRFNPGPWQDLDVCLCKCHPQGIHEGTMDYNQLWETASFCNSPQSKSELYQRMIGKSWDCLLLSECKYYKDFIIVDWDSTIAHRVGAITIRVGDHEIDPWQNTKRRIKLA